MATLVSTHGTPHPLHLRALTAILGALMAGSLLDVSSCTPKRTEFTYQIVLTPLLPFLAALVTSDRGLGVTSIKLLPTILGSLLPRLAVWPMNDFEMGSDLPARNLIVVSGRRNGTPVRVLDQALAVLVGREGDLDGIATTAIGLDVWLRSRHLITSTLLEPIVVVNAGVLGRDVSGDRNGVAGFGVSAGRVEKELGTSMFISFRSTTGLDRFDVHTQHTTEHHRHSEPGEEQGVRHEGCSNLCTIINAQITTATR